MSNETRVMAVKLPDEVYKAIHHRAVDEQRPVRSIVIEALERFLSQQEGKGK
jgi:predicted transcriptional regulator